MILRLLLLFAVLLATGCQTPDATHATANEDQPDPSHSGEITPGSPAYSVWRTKAKSGTPGKSDADVITEGEILQLPKFVVQEKGFVDYGFSIITNEEVLRNKPVKWVQVGVVLLALGIGFWFVQRNVMVEIAPVFSSMGVIAAALGLGAIGSGVVSYLLSVRFGLLKPGE